MKQQFNLAYKIWDIAYPVCIYYAAIVIGILVAQLVFGGGNENYMLCKIFGSLVATFVVYTEYRHDLTIGGRFGAKPHMTFEKLLNLLAVTGIMIILSVSLNNLISMSPLPGLSEGYQNASDALYGSNIVLELIGSALVTPILEELLHRGVVYGKLRKMMGLWPAVLVSALIFATLHFNIVQFLYTFLLGIALAFFVEKTNRIYPAVIAHMAANGIAVIRTETGFLKETADGSIFAWVISAALCIMGIIGWFLYSRSIIKKKS